MKKGLTILPALFLSLFQLSCSSVHARSGSERVKVFELGGTAPKNCTSLGDIQGDQNPLAFATDKTLEDGAMSSLRNNAIDMGANVVIITQTRNRMAGGTVFGEKKTEVHHKGKAFKCAEDADGKPVIN